jgi:hypothetical protein
MSPRMLELLMHGVSTRNYKYKAVIPQMAETTGVSESRRGAPGRGGYIGSGSTFEYPR